MSSEALDSAQYCAGTLKQLRRMACVIGSQDGALWGIDQSDEWTRLADNLIGESLIHSGALILNYVHRLREVELQYPETDWFHFGDSSKATSQIGQMVADGAFAVHMFEMFLNVRMSPSWRSNIPATPWAPDLGDISAEDLQALIDQRVKQANPPNTPEHTFMTESEADLIGHALSANMSDGTEAARLAEQAAVTSGSVASAPPFETFDELRSYMMTATPLCCSPILSQSKS